jgi:hypothetical protein
MIMHNHPEYKEHPSVVVKIPPEQTRGKSLTEYRRGRVSRSCLCW